jgi:hypothetical protein
MTDDDLRAIWRNKGGDFHGPRIETGTMPEYKLLPFLRELMQSPQPAPKHTEEEFDRIFGLACGLQYSVSRDEFAEELRRILGV